MKNEADRQIWLNGQIINVNDAKINVLSPSFQFGANVFEGIRCYWSESEEQLYAFRLEEHYNRLKDSIRLFRMKCQYTDSDFKQALVDIIRANDYKEDIAVRQTVFIEGFGSWFATEPVGMFVAPIAKKRKTVPLCDGEHVCVSSWERISDRNLSPRAKVGANYINSRLAKLEAKDNGCDAALFLDNAGHVSEGPGSCFFMVKNGTFITPLITDSILDSITRKTIIELAKKELRLEVQERSIVRTELYTCDEAFFCGSAVEITPIIKIDGYDVNSGTVGEMTKKLHISYLDVVTGKNKKYSSWLTPIYD